MSNQASKQDVGPGSAAWQELHSTLHAVGDSIRRQVVGESYVDRSLSNANDFTMPMQKLATEYAWGGIWSRPGWRVATAASSTLACLRRWASGPSWLRTCAVRSTTASAKPKCKSACCSGDVRGHARRHGGLSCCRQGGAGVEGGARHGCGNDEQDQLGQSIDAP